MDPLTLAVLLRLAKNAGDDDLVEYLGHSSQFSDVILTSAATHTQNLADLDKFKYDHELLTHPGQPVRTYTQAEFDAAIAASMKKAQAPPSKSAISLKDGD